MASDVRGSAHNAATFNQDWNKKQKRLGLKLARMWDSVVVYETFVACFTTARYHWNQVEQVEK